MTIDFKCPHCGQQMEVDEQYAGQTGPCKQCGEKITIPFDSATPKNSSPYASPASPKSNSAVPLVLIICGVAAVLLLVCGGGLVALILPAVGQARQAAQRMACSNNLHQIGIAFHNYHDVHGTFPPAQIHDVDGKPLHSWRTLILPYLETVAGYDQYNFSAAWDSPENSFLSDRPMSIYCCPQEGVPTNETSYMVITCEGGLFDGQRASKLTDVANGTSQTLLVVEVPGKKVPWASPVDISLDELTDMIQSGQLDAAVVHTGGLNAVYADASVTFVDGNVILSNLNSMVTQPRMEGDSEASVPTEDEDSDDRSSSNTTGSEADSAANEE